MRAVVTQTNETCNPYRRYKTGEAVTGPEASRLIGLGLAVYNEQEPGGEAEEPDPTEPSSNPDDVTQKES